MRGYLCPGKEGGEGGSSVKVRVLCHGGGG